GIGDDGEWSSMDHWIEQPREPRGHVWRWKCDPYESPSEHYGLVRELRNAVPVEAATCVLTALKESSLRGMGGAGFPTGTKWEVVRSEPRLPKYIICNADESEPGTFKDREILLTLPHLLIEAMLLAGLV